MTECEMNELRNMIERVSDAVNEGVPIFIETSDGERIEAHDIEYSAGTIIIHTD